MRWNMAAFALEGALLLAPQRAASSDQLAMKQ
jgi:hypothetical protein